MCNHHHHHHRMNRKKKKSRKICVTDTQKRDSQQKLYRILFCTRSIKKALSIVLYRKRYISFAFQTKNQRQLSTATTVSAIGYRHLWFVLSATIQHETDYFQWKNKNSNMCEQQAQANKNREKKNLKPNMYLTRSYGYFYILYQRDSTITNFLQMLPFFSCIGLAFVLLLFLLVGRNIFSLSLFFRVFAISASSFFRMFRIIFIIVGLLIFVAFFSPVQLILLLSFILFGVYAAIFTHRKKD